MTGEKQQLLCPLRSLCMRQRKGGQRGKGRGREESELWEIVQGKAPKTNAMTHLTTRMKHGGGRELWWGREEISTFSLNFKTKVAPGWRDGRKHYVLAALPVSSPNAEQQIHISLKEWNRPSCPATEVEPPSSGTISVRKQSTELALNDELPWSTTKRCWLFLGRGTCSCWQSTDVLPTFPLIESVVFQKLWKNGCK